MTKKVTKAELLKRFAEGRYIFQAPPVCPQYWSNWDWCRFVLSYGGFGDVELES